MNTDSLFLANSSNISTSVAESDGQGGNITIDNEDFIVGRNNNQIEANAFLGDGGKVTINTAGLFFDNSSKITAISRFGDDGVVEINNIESEKKLSTLQVANTVEAPPAIVASNCPVSKDNTFAITGKGGMSLNPGQYLGGQTVWQDLRVPAIRRSSPQISGYSVPSTLIEAQTWQINQGGKVELLAKAAGGDRKGHEFQCSSAFAP
ncbi:MAG: hypothetical protein AAFO95_13290 [Cyanobacteria bacterium J06600_6]